MENETGGNIDRMKDKEEREGLKGFFYFFSILSLDSCPCGS